MAEKGDEQREFWPDSSTARAHSDVRMGIDLMESTERVDVSMSERAWRSVLGQSRSDEEVPSAKRMKKTVQLVL